jgi:hypothetical protein
MYFSQNGNRLISLNLRSNEIEESALEDLERLIFLNPCLISLNIDKNYIDKKHLRKLLEINDKLTIILNQFKLMEKIREGHKNDNIFFKFRN